MPQVICAFFSAEARQEQAECSVDSRNGSRFDATQKLLEFAICHLDRVEVRGVFRQIPKRCPSLFDNLAHAGTGVGSAIVDDDDVTALQRWTKTLLQIGQKHLCCHGSLE